MYTVILWLFYLFYSRFLSGAIPDDFLKSIREEDPSVEVVVDLSDNFITDLSSSLTTFTNMNLVLVDSDITSPAPEELCDTDHNGWTAGMVGQVRDGGALNACNAILCPPGSYNKDGRLSVTRGCDVCTSCTTFGCTSCIDETPTNGNKVCEILNELFTKTSGRAWYNNDNWLVVGKDICEY
mmetsp:Transcript_6762/g.8998  ORF Transcript_6762/g.8998 Transcript_6762/m.8998 type:complete len:182 (-) Transcript_6762:229-774(-)